MPAQFIMPANKLKQKVGASSLADDVMAMGALEQVIERLEPDFAHVIAQNLEDLRAIKSPFTGGGLAQIYEIAHSIRGFAGSFSRIELSSLTDSLCQYIDAAQKSIGIDERLIMAHINAICMFAEVGAGEKEAAAIILSSLRQAVAKKMANV